MRTCWWPLYTMTLALLAAPSSVQAGPPITIGDGSVCMDNGGLDFPRRGKTYSRGIELVKVLVDDVSETDRCTPAAGGRDFGTPKTVVVTYEAAGKSETITITFADSHRDVNMSSTADLSTFADVPGQGRKRIIRQDATLKSIAVDGALIQCPGHCRVTLLGK